MQQAAGNHLASDAAAPPHRFVGPWSEHFVHPSTRVGWAAGLQPHHISTGLKGELMAKHWSQLDSPHHHVPSGQQGIEGTGSEFRGDRFKSLYGKNRHSSVHVRCLAKEPVANNSFASHQFRLVGVSGGDIGGAFPGTAKVGVRRRH